MASRFLFHAALVLAALIAAAASARAFEVATPRSEAQARAALEESWSRELASRRGGLREGQQSVPALRLLESGREHGPAVDAAGWTLLPAPAQRSQHAAVLDPVRNRMIMLGGEDWWAGIGYGDVWELALSDPPAWTHLEPQGSPPGLLSGHSAVYDPTGDRILVFGGGTDLWSLTLSDPPTWNHLTSAGSPPPLRRGHSAVIDVTRNRMIVFGGWNGSPLQDLWELTLDGTPTWTELTPTGATPAGRDHHSAIVDPLGDHMIVYGGWNDRSDVWQLSLADFNWTELTPGGSAPTGRWAHTAVLDLTRQRMVVFGGESHGVSNESWALSLDGTSTWSLLSPGGPLPIKRLGHVAILDPARDRMVAFGGEDWDDLPLRDVWSLSLGSGPAWGEIAPAGAAPAGRLSPTGVLDPARDRIVVFGGESGGYLNDGGAGNPTTNTVLTLSLNGDSSWKLEPASGPSPGARLEHSAMLDPDRDQMIVFGGAADRWAAGSSDLWALDLGNWTWTSMAPTGTNPGPLRGHSATYDPLRARMIVFGGAPTASGTAVNDVWMLSLDGSAWTLLVPAGTPPSPRRGHSAALDSNGDRLIVFGGCSPSGVELDDVWALSLGGEPEWTELTPAGSPPAARSGHVALFDAANDRLLIHGGLTSEGPSSEVWTLSLGAVPIWEPLAPEEVPPPRSEHVAVIDPGRQRMVVFGGWDGEFVLRNDVWSLSWNEAPNAAVPGPAQTTLLAARPNPFRPGGRVAFELARAADISLEVYDVRGRRVETLARGVQGAGRHEVTWAAQAIAPGVYFLCLTGDGLRARQRVVVVR